MSWSFYRVDNVLSRGLIGHRGTQVEYRAVEVGRVQGPFVL